MKEFDWHGMWSPSLPPWEVALRATLIYLFIQLMLRLTGRKELGRYSTPDIVLLFLIGTAARMSIVADDSSLTSAFVGFGTLLGVDRLIAYLTYRFDWVRRLVEGRPRTLVEDGKPIDQELRRARISRDELLSSLRSKGKDDLTQVKRAYMEPDGQISFLFRSEGERSPA